MPLKRRAVAILCLSLFLGCGAEEPKPQARPSQRQPIQVADQPILASLAAGEGVELLEGLPHHELIEQLDAERAKGIHVELHGSPFYEEPLALTTDDRQKLLTMLGSDGTLLTFSGEKKCGGFHADYALTWKAAGVENAALFCFGCGEVKLFGPQGEFRYDIGAKDSLAQILEPYVRNRPKPENSAAIRAR